MSENERYPTPNAMQKITFYKNRKITSFDAIGALFIPDGVGYYRVFPMISIEYFSGFKVYDSVYMVNEKCYEFSLQYVDENSINVYAQHVGHVFLIGYNLNSKYIL